MKQTTLRDAIDGKTTLTDDQINAIVYLFCGRCKPKGQVEVNNGCVQYEHTRRKICAKT